MRLIRTNPSWEDWGVPLFFLLITLFSLGMGLHTKHPSFHIVGGVWTLATVWTWRILNG